jgi:hypothetical protein
MSDVTLTYPSFTDGDVAYGSQVQQNFEDVLAVVNADIDDDNIANDGITASDKIIDGTISAPLLEAGCVRHAAVDWSSTNSGVRAWRTQNHVGTAGGRIIRVRKTVTLAAVTTEANFTVDWSAGDAVDGNTTFSVAPVVGGWNIVDDANCINGDADVELKYIVTKGVTTTGCTVYFRFSGAPTAGDVVFEALVAGAA